MFDETKQTSDWPLLDIPATDLLLDANNPRLDIPSNASQQEIREALFRKEDIIDLAESIVEYGSLYPTESLIAIRDNGRYRVLEGNRRLCVMQCLANNSLVPAEFNAQFEEISNNANQALINPSLTLRVTVAPSWESAQPLITSKHAVYAVKKWNYLSKWKRDYLSFEQKGTIAEVGRILDETESNVQVGIELYRLFIRIRQNPLFSSREKAIIDSNDIEATRLTWHLSNQVKGILGISWNEKHELVIATDEAKFNHMMRLFALACFVSKPPKITTRVGRIKVLEYLKRWSSEYEAARGTTPATQTIQPVSTGVISSQSESTTSSHPMNEAAHTARIKPEKYFERLSCVIDDQRMQRLTIELSELSKRDRIETYPAAVIMLIRALLESCLRFQIVNKNRQPDICREYKRDFEEIRLSEILKFTINNRKDLFRDHRNAKRVLDKIESEHREYLNSIVHGSWLDPTPSKIEGIAGDIRELLRAILNGSA